MGFDDEDDEPPSAAGAKKPGRSRKSGEEDAGGDGAGGGEGIEACADELQDFAKKVADMRKKLKTYGTKKDDKKFRDGFRRDRDKLRGNGKKMLHKIQAIKTTDRAGQRKLIDSYKQMDADLAKMFDECKRLEVEHTVQAPPAPKVEAVGDGGFELQMEEVDDAALDEERNAELLGVEDDMEGLADLVGDLATMVSEQGEALNTIENNITETRENVTEAVDSLEAAADYQKSARQKQALMALGLLLGLIGAGVAIYFVVGGGGDETTIVQQVPDSNAAVDPAAPALAPVAPAAVPPVAAPPAFPAAPPAAPPPALAFPVG